MREGWEAEYFAIPYRDGGRDHDGVDCYGLVVLVYREQFGVEIAPFEFVDRETAGLQAIWSADVESKWRRIADHEVSAGDVVEIRLGDRPHCGIMLDRNKMLHARQAAGVSIEPISKGYWCRRVTGIYRHHLLME